MAVYLLYFFLWASLILFSFSNIHPFVMVACRGEGRESFSTSNILSLLYMIACQLVMYICILFLCGLVFYHSICFIAISLSRVLVLGVSILNIDIKSFVVNLPYCTVVNWCMCLLLVSYIERKKVKKYKWISEYVEQCTI